MCFGTHTSGKGELDVRTVYVDPVHTAFEFVSDAHSTCLCCPQNVLQTYGVHKTYVDTLVAFTFVFLLNCTRLCQKHQVRKKGDQPNEKASSSMEEEPSLATSPHFSTSLLLLILHAIAQY